MYCNSNYETVTSSWGYGQLLGDQHSFRSFSLVIRFLHRIISSKKKAYLSISISQQIAWYPQSQTFVCSAINELKYQPWLSWEISSGYAAGLQCSWQKTSVLECFDLKWKTSTVRLISLKNGSSLTILASVQLWSKKTWSGLMSSWNMHLIISCWLVSGIVCDMRDEFHMITLPTPSAP